jgi:transcription elongation factor Elf1
MQRSLVTSVGMFGCGGRHWEAKHATVPAFSVEAHSFVRSFCPECHDLMVAATQSQHVDKNVVRHWWSCESCGHEFRTTVQLPALPVEACQHAMA